MGILPKIIENTSAEDNVIIKTKGHKTYIVDFKNKKMGYFNGKPKINDDVESIKMFIQKLVLTELNDWEFHKNYGTVFVSETYGKKYSSIVHRVNIEQNLKEQLLKHEYILSLPFISIKQIKNTLNIKLTVMLKTFDIIDWEGDIVI